MSTLSHASFKRVDHIKLATLQSLLADQPFEDCLGPICKPALLHPESEEVGLHQVPPELVAGIAQLDAHAIHKRAQEWAADDEVQADGFSIEDCSEVLTELHRLAVTASRTNSGMYFFWSL